MLFNNCSYIKFAFLCKTWDVRSVLTRYIADRMNLKKRYYGVTNRLSLIIYILKVKL